ncbi:MAG: isoprenylcysteine carboxylmethyltransferase family protein [Candidatus Hydrogenedentes bacterium]|nr:isoprenylcysteine carboxylmethyltransferase family protein [Candidatus Hydrogenedentota bacterium]
MAEPYNNVYRIRGLLMVPAFLVLVLCFLGETERDGVVWPIGLAVFAVGVAIRVWAQMHLHYRLRVRKTLTTTGPYAYVRNPIYIGNTAIMLGLTCVSELLWFLPIMFLWCMAVYTLTVRREEAHLLGKYGEPYAEYLRNVPRWIPAVGRGQEHRGRRRRARRFLWPSILAEAHCLLWLIPLAGKEWLALWR